MSERTLARSFAGGEITPELFARLDLAKFQTGLALASNVEILPHGPAVNRAGFEYVIQCKYNDKEAILLPYDYVSSQSYVLEFGDYYMRVHTLGATVLEDSHAITGITQAGTGVLTHDGSYTVTEGQWFYLETSGMDGLDQRFVIATNVAGSTFELYDLFGDPINTLTYTAFVSGTLARVYEIETPFAEADLFDLHYSQDGFTMTIVNQNYPVYELVRVASTNWTLTTPTWEPAQIAPTGVAATASGSGGVSYGYTVTAIADDENHEESYAATADYCNNDLTVQGNYNTVHWTDADNASRYNVYKYSNGLFGYIGQADSGSAGFKDDNITADISQTPPEAYSPFNSSNYYPGAVGYFEGRRWFAGSKSKPGNLYGTRSGTDTNMAYSMPTRDDDSISVRLKSQKLQTIRHIVALSEMLLLTSGGEWRIIAENSDVVTPTTLGYKPQSYVGASNVQPALAASAILYAQDRGGHIRSLRYSWEQQGYSSMDASIMAPHLFDYKYTINQMAFIRQPVPCLWCVRDDGALLAMTYLPEQEVFAWHQHHTDGYFESVCVASEDITGIE
jgi:hypothetical protein